MRNEHRRPDVWRENKYLRLRTTPRNSSTDDKLVGMKIWLHYARTSIFTQKIKGQ